MVSFITITFVVAKLTFWKFWVPNQHLCINHFWWVFGYLLPQIWFNFAKTCTRNGILADKNSVWRVFEKLELNFYKKMTNQIFTFGQTLNAHYPLKMTEVEKKIFFPGKTLTSGLSKYVKIKFISSLSFLGQIQLCFALFGLFLLGNRVGSRIQGAESKFDTAYFTNNIPGRLNVKHFSSSTFLSSASTKILP